MILEYMINFLKYLFRNDLNIADPQIYEILPSMLQTQFSVALIAYLSTARLEYSMTQNNYDQHIIA